jgi:hypothetical protein
MSQMYICLHIMSQMYICLHILSQMYICLHVKYRLFLSDLPLNLNFLERFSRNTQISSFMKIRPVGVKLFHTNGRKDGNDEASSRFSQFFQST